MPRVDPWGLQGGEIGVSSGGLGERDGDAGARKRYGTDLQNGQLVVNIACSAKWNPGQWFW